MAKEQRGETAASAAKNMVENAEDFSLSLDSSDDEAPEEVTFEQSKSEALRGLKEALHAAKREKEELKEKRRRKHELFQEQKKQRLLPDDLLEKIDSAASSQKKKKKKKRPKGQADGDDAKRQKLPDSLKFKGSYTVTTVEKVTSVSVRQQAAEEFIKNRFYGPGSCRTTNNELLSLQNKKSRDKSAAVQFVKKDWASKERVKAEKLKKRWLHKQQIDSC